MFHFMFWREQTYIHEIIVSHAIYSLLGVKNFSITLHFILKFKFAPDISTRIDIFFLFRRREMFTPNAAVLVK
jgi:hypothetical protein